MSEYIHHAWGYLRVLGWLCYLFETNGTGCLKGQEGLEIQLPVTDNIPGAFTFLAGASCSYLQVWEVTQHSLQAGQNYQDDGVNAKSRGSQLGDLRVQRLEEVALSHVTGCYNPP